MQGDAAEDGMFLSPGAVWHVFAVWLLASTSRAFRMLSSRGEIAQLGERRVRNAKVGSSILLRSTKRIKGLADG